MRPPQHAEHALQLQMDAFAMLEQDAQRAAPLPFRHARRRLTGEEQQALLGRAAPAVHAGTRVTRSVQWSDVADEFEQTYGSAADRFEHLHAHVAGLAHAYSSTDSAGRGGSGTQVSTGHLMNSAFGRETASDLQESMRVFHQSPVDACVQPVRLADLATKLRSVLDRVRAAEERAGGALLQALAFRPPTEAGTAVAAFQAAAVMAEPAAADLLRITVCPETLTVRSHSASTRPVALVEASTVALIPCDPRMSQHGSSIQLSGVR